MAVMKQAIPADCAVIMRVASHVANILEPLLRRRRHPYGLEVVVDPYDFFSPGASPHPLRPLIRMICTIAQGRQCARACAVAYVTESALQRRYPASPDALTIAYSSVALGDDAFVPSPRPLRSPSEQPTLVHVGHLDLLYKAPDVLVDAVRLCPGSGLRLVLVGDGRYRQYLEARVRSLGLGGAVRFAGCLPSGDAVRVELDQADLFVLPSRQEGLPRAMVEAMARALPCIGSTVGGIPELLPPEDLVRPGDPAALARRIWGVLGDPERLARMSARNLEVAQRYHETHLRSRRIIFYQHLREQTEAWIRGPDR